LIRDCVSPRHIISECSVKASFTTSWVRLLEHAIALPAVKRSKKACRANIAPRRCEEFFVFSSQSAQCMVLAVSESPTCSPMLLLSECMGLWHGKVVRDMQKTSHVSTPSLTPHARLYAHVRLSFLLAQERLGVNIQFICVRSGIEDIYGTFQRDSS